MTWLSWVVFISALFAAGVDAIYLVKFPKGSKWWLRFTNAAAIIYVGFIYLLLGLDFWELTQPPPFLIRPPIALLLLLLASESLFDVLQRD